MAAQRSAPLRSGRHTEIFEFIYCKNFIYRLCLHAKTYYYKCIIVVRDCVACSVGLRPDAWDRNLNTSLGFFVVWGFFGFDILFTQRCWWFSTIIKRHIWRRNVVRRYVLGNKQREDMFLIGNWFWFRYFIGTALLVIIHIICTQKWAGGFTEPSRYRCVCEYIQL